MGSAIGDLLPLAFGVALSPIPIIAVILMLATPKAPVTGSAFAMGWVTGLVVVSIVVVLLATGAHDADSGASTTVAVIELVLGALFLLLASKQWRDRAVAVTPKWMEAIDTFGVGKAFGFGAALSGANPKNLALTVSAAASIGRAGLDGGETAVAIAVFVVIGSLTVAVPVLFALLAPAKAAKSLVPVKDFLAEHNGVIMMVVLLILGAKILGNGIAGLSD